MGNTLSRVLTGVGNAAGDAVKGRVSESLRNELEGVLREALKEAIEEALVETRAESAASASTAPESGRRRRGPGALLWLGVGVAIGYLLADREIELSPETYEAASQQLRKLSEEASERIEPYAGERSEQIQRITEDVADQLDEQAAEQRAKRRPVPSVGRRGPLAVLALGSVAVAGYLLIKRRDSTPEWQSEVDDWEAESTDVAVGNESTVGGTADDTTEIDGDDESESEVEDETEPDSTAL